MGKNSQTKTFFKKNKVSGRTVGAPFPFPYSKRSSAQLLLLASQSVKTFCLYVLWIFALLGVNIPHPHPPHPLQVQKDYSVPPSGFGWKTANQGPSVIMGGCSRVKQFLYICVISLWNHIKAKITFWALKVCDGMIQFTVSPWVNSFACILESFERMFINPYISIIINYSVAFSWKVGLPHSLNAGSCSQS